MSTRVLSARSRLVRPSPTLAMTAKARQMKADGQDVLSFAVGEPDFNTPEPICDAAVDAVRAGMTKYAPSAGLGQLREAVAEKLVRENGIRDASASEVMVSCGAKHCVFNALQVLIDPGDEVILLAPYWMTYLDQVVLAGGTPVVVRSHDGTGFVPDLEEVRAAVTSRTRAIIVNSPCNPTGAMLGRDEMKQIAALAMRHDLWIVSDEIYERLTYGPAHQSLAALGREVAERTVTVTGCSKTYAMTGWRIGFAHAPAPVIKAMCDLQDQVTSNATTFAQAGALRAIEMGPKETEPMRAEFQARRDLILAGLRGIPGLDVLTPDGAFYVFPRVTTFLQGRVTTDAALADFLLERALVATVPGSVFEGAGHIRLSYATSKDEIQRGVARIAEALESLRS